MGTVITNEAVYAAAKAHFERQESYWDDMRADAKAEALDDMRAALEAAAPHMLATKVEE